jgi:hypothetical protein
MTENSAIFNARHGADSFRPHRQPAPTAQDCLKRGNGANWRTTRQLSGECRLHRLDYVIGGCALVGLFRGFCHGGQPKNLTGVAEIGCYGLSGSKLAQKSLLSTGSNQ